MLPPPLTPHTQLGVLHYNRPRSPQRTHQQRRGDWVNILPTPRERLETLLPLWFPVNDISERLNSVEGSFQSFCQTLIRSKTKISRSAVSITSSPVRTQLLEIGIRVSCEVYLYFWKKFTHSRRPRQCYRWHLALLNCSQKKTFFVDLRFRVAEVS